MSEPGGMRDLVRTDEELKREVLHALRDLSAFGLGSITAEIESGVVALRGTVPSERALTEAEDLALRIPGVRRVANHLAVRPPAEASVAEEVLERGALLGYRVLLLWVLLAILVLVGGIAITIGSTRLNEQSLQLVALAGLVLGALLAAAARARRR